MKRPFLDIDDERLIELDQTFPEELQQRFENKSDPLECLALQTNKRLSSRADQLPNSSATYCKME